MTKVEETKIENIKPDSQNANRHTQRGEGMIRESIHKFGFAEAGTLDKNNRLIGGNLRTEAAADLGMEDAIIVDVDGTKPVYIRRKDMDLESTEDTKARELAYALNRVPQISIDFDPEKVLADLNAGVDLSSFFLEEELGALIDEIPEVEFPEYDEEVENDVEYIECPHCGEKFPK